MVSSFLLVENSSNVQNGFNENDDILDRRSINFGIYPHRLLSTAFFLLSSDFLSPPFFACLLIFCATGTSRSVAGFSLLVLCCRRHSAR